MNNQNSRFITYPDILDKSQNHTVLLVDADLDDVANLATFCSVSVRNYDVYLYTHAKGDLEWLSYLSARLDKIFVKHTSPVTVTDQTRYLTVTDLQEYFTKIDTTHL